MSRRKTLAFAMGGLVASIAGALVQAKTSPPQSVFFWAIVSVSLLGLSLSLLFFSPPRRTLFFVLSALVYRVSYFPLMVFAGFVAALSEASVGAALVWPTFLVFLFIANFAIGAIIAMLLGAPLPPLGSRLRWALLLFAASQIALATTVSFTTAGDFSWLPDRPRPELLAPPISAPVSNPYRDPKLPPAPTWASSVLRLAAGSTYDLVPASPWSRGVQGTLEALSRAQPLAGSDERIADHHRAYMAAHALLHRAP